ncbi:DUF3100 domain-containing protein [Angelakisella massiliensis]|uniref:DUF3100 domain-containing protein n=1 Tax=Angelakisella massiliensis TaxID=1871018 RepID=UPI0008F826C8|nr:DUF3100 domain-containing protein [Angelakisella massiliensis]
MSNQVEKNQPDNTQQDNLSTKGRWPVFIKLFAVCGIAAGIGEIIGTISIPVGPGNLIILPMIFAMILAVLITPDALGRKIEALKQICSEKEVKLSEDIMMLVLLILGVKLGMAAGPNITKVIEAGPALILQEFGNLGTMVVGLPVAMLLGMRREAVGATLSICREPTLGLISEIYGIDSPEGIGVMGTYMVGNLFGTIFFGLLGSFGVLTGIHPYALGMACGMGSGSMMTAASQALAASVPEMAEEVLAFAATSNICTNVDGLYMELFIALPVANFIYKKLSAVMYRNKTNA